MNQIFNIEVELEVKRTEVGDVFEATAFLRKQASTAQESNLGCTVPSQSRDRACAISYALSELASMLYHGAIKL